MTEETKPALSKRNIHRFLGGGVTAILLVSVALAIRSSAASEKRPSSHPLSPAVKDHVDQARALQRKKTHIRQMIRDRDLQADDVLEPELLFLGRTSGDFNLAQDQAQIFIMFGDRGAEITCETSADAGGDADLALFVGLPDEGEEPAADCVSSSLTSSETCTVNLPNTYSAEDTEIIALVTAFSDTTGITIRCTDTTSSTGSSSGTSNTGSTSSSTGGTSTTTGSTSSNTGSTGSSSSGGQAPDVRATRISPGRTSTPFDLEAKVFVVSPPTGADGLACTATADSGSDIAVHMRHGAVPSRTSHECSKVGLSNAMERCEVILSSSSLSNNVYILVSTFSLATNVKISCEGIYLAGSGGQNVDTVSANENSGSSGSTSSGSSGEPEVYIVDLTLGRQSSPMNLLAGEGIVYGMTPSFAANGVTCTTSGTGGDLDLAMWVGEGFDGNFECGSESLTNTEVCSVRTQGREPVFAVALAHSSVRSVKILCQETYL